jgi:DNA topoisomerase-1
MKSLKHNGIMVPAYEPKGFSVTINGHKIKLKEKSEQMAVAWVRRNLSTTIAPPDAVFKKNFMKAFLVQLKAENTSDTFLDEFTRKYISNIDNSQTALNKNCGQVDEIDFADVRNFIVQEKAAKEAMTKEEKKKIAEERKEKRTANKEKYGFATVDGQKLEIANWTAEPSCLFAGRGDHPQRGKWKEGPCKDDITLNLSPDAPKPEGWKVTWEPDKMYVAKWEDKLTGKIKYVWFSDTAFLKQNREKEKFQKAETLGKQIRTIEQHILRNLDDKDEARRKVATVSWLILAVNMRVGDEKDPDEADTVGAITLRKEHISFPEDGKIHFDFLGKDSVRWEKDVSAPPEIIHNIQNFMDTSKDYLFEGVDSKKVSRFLSEKMPKLTAKVFRTWKCTSTLEDALKKQQPLEKEPIMRDSPDYLKTYHAKIANYEVAVVANHKKKIAPTFDQRLAKKEDNLKNLQEQLKAKKKAGKKTESLEARIAKAELDINLTKLTKEYNLGTSLKSYIDPAAYVKWAKKVKFDIEKFYPKTLRNKFSWALQSGKAEAQAAECITA